MAEDTFRTSCPEVPRIASSDETRHDALTVPVAGGEALEQRVGIRCVANGKRADLVLLTDAVEDDDTTRAAHGDEAGELVHELAHIGPPPA